MANLNQFPVFFANAADTSNAGVIILAGDMGGTYNVPLVKKLNGVSLPTGAPNVNDTLIASDATHFVYGPATGGSSGVPVAKRTTSATFGATVTPNADTTDIMRLTLTGTAAIANPTGTPVSGQILQMEISQDGTGSRTVTWGNAYAFSTDIPSPTLTTTANKMDILVFQWSVAASKWRFVGIIHAY